MVSNKVRITIYLISILIIGLALFIYHLISIYNEKAGNKGLLASGLKMQIQLQQVPQRKQLDFIPEEDLEFELKKDDGLAKKKEAKNKKPKKQKTKANKKENVAPQKQVIDKGRIGEATLKYAHKINGYIQRNMTNPDDIYQTYVVYVRFRLNGNGDVILVNIKKSSTNKRVDDFALDTIKLLSPFPKPPLLVRQGDMTFVIPLEYRYD